MLPSAVASAAHSAPYAPNRTNMMLLGPWTPPVAPCDNVPTYMLLSAVASAAHSAPHPHKQDKDGVIWPWDTARGFRDIGYNQLISFLAPFFIHTGMSLPTQEGFPNLLLPIYIKNIHKCKQ
eukprot:GHUV01042904.1.p1 GENE.GHUV01042904.1~~GHUV01042904.1.p1  ORF type:complete len:122 (-),score=15.99 GHUV01042904.1:275-640(-)